jgi:hypothetical protein
MVWLGRNDGRSMLVCRLNGAGLDIMLEGGLVRLGLEVISRVETILAIILVNLVHKI